MVTSIVTNMVARSSTAANLEPFLSIRIPAKKHPIISPKPNTTIAIIDFWYYSCESKSRIVEVSIETSTPE